MSDFINNLRWKLVLWLIGDRSALVNVTVSWCKLEKEKGGIIHNLTIAKAPEERK